MKAVLKFILLSYLLLVSVSAWSFEREFSVKHSDGVTYHCVVHYSYETEKLYKVYITYTDKYNNAYTGDIIIPKQLTYNDNTYLVTSIGIEAFSHCKGLKSVTIHEDIDNIDYNAFNYSSDLINIFVNPENKIYFSQDGVLYNKVESTLVCYPCGKENNTIIPNWVTIIGHEAFSECEKITQITIPNTIKTIERFAFNKCSSLTEITIPESVTGIGFWAFSGCTSLQFIKCLANTPPGAPNSFVTDNKIPLYVPDISISKYQEAESWNEFNNILPLSQITSNESIELKQYKCFGLNNNIIIENLLSKECVSIYSISGNLIKQIYPKQSIVNISIPSGIYIVKIDNRIFKVKV